MRYNKTTVVDIAPAGELSAQEKWAVANGGPAAKSLEDSYRAGAQMMGLRIFVKYASWQQPIFQEDLKKTYYAKGCDKSGFPCVGYKTNSIYKYLGYGNDVYPTEVLGISVLDDQPHLLLEFTKNSKDSFMAPMDHLVLPSSNSL